MRIERKTWPKPFQAIMDGVKTFDDHKKWNRKNRRKIRALAEGSISNLNQPLPRRLAA